MFHEGYDVLLFMDSIEEVMHLSAESQMDPDFAARIDLIQVEAPMMSQTRKTEEPSGTRLSVMNVLYRILGLAKGHQHQ